MMFVKSVKSELKSGLSAVVVTGLMMVAGASPATASPCSGYTPVTGGEHSVGTGATFLQALFAFCNSPAVKAQMGTLDRWEFSPAAEQPEATLISNTCVDDAENCSAEYDVRLPYANAALGERVVSGKYQYSRFGGDNAHGYFIPAELDTAGIGRVITFSGPFARRFMDALFTEGVYDERRIMGAADVYVGRIDCSRPVVPNPVPYCEMTFNGVTAPVSADVALTLEFTLRTLGAFSGPPVVGATNTGADLVRCHRVVVPDMPTNCSLIAE